MLTDRSKSEQAEALELLREYGPKPSEVLLDVHYTTVRRWLDGSSKIPRAVLLALRAAVRAELPNQSTVKCDGQSWYGWKFAQDGRLYTPEGDSVSPGDVRAIPYQRELIRTLQRDTADLRKALQKELEYANHGANDAVVGPVTGRSGPPAEMQPEPRWNGHRRA